MHEHAIDGVWFPLIDIIDSDGNSKPLFSVIKWLPENLKLHYSEVLRGL